MLVLGSCRFNLIYNVGNLKDEYPHLKIAQWFLDPLNKNGPDFKKNKKRY